MRAEATCAVEAFLVVAVFIVGCQQTNRCQPDMPGDPASQEAQKSERVVVATLSGLISDKEAVHEEVKTIKGILKDCGVVAQHQGSLAWLIWVDADKRKEAHNAIQCALDNKQLKYVSIAGQRADKGR